MNRKPKEIPSVCIVLHNIRSALNVGAIFRTADAAGAEKLYLTGFTPTPLDRFGRPQKEVAKTALGAEKTVAWEHTNLLLPLIRRLQKNGVFVIAVEQSPSARDYRTIRVPSSVAFIFGNEVTGLPENILAACDCIAEIPLHGAKESLNVAVAAGIALFRMLDI